MKILKRLWSRLQRVKAPVGIPAIAIAPVAPMRQEQFPDIPGARQAGQQADVRLSSLYERVVRANNANVTRDFGRGPVVIHHDRSVAPLSTEEITELGGIRAGVEFYRPKKGRS